MLTRENRKIEGMMKMRMEWNNNGNQNMVSKLAGIALVVVGMIIAGNALGWWSVSLFFRGWWTLFIIIPCALRMKKDGFHSGAGFGLILGFLLLLSQWHIFSFGGAISLIIKLAIPVLLILYGLKIVTQGKSFSSNHNSGYKNFGMSGAGMTEGYVQEENYNAIFGSREADFSQEEFHGTSTCAVFGGTDLNLRNAVIIDDVIINATAIFGGVDIFLPQDVNVRVASTAIFGGTDNQIKRPEMPEWPTVYIKATAIFGGIDIH